MSEVDKQGQWGATPISKDEISYADYLQSGCPCCGKQQGSALIQTSRFAVFRCVCDTAYKVIFRNEQRKGVTMFKTTIGFNEVLQLPTTGFVRLEGALVWEAFQDFLNLGDANVATVWYNEAQIKGQGFRRSHYTIQITEKGYEVTFHEEKSS